MASYIRLLPVDKRYCYPRPRPSQPPPVVTEILNFEKQKNIFEKKRVCSLSHKQCSQSNTCRFRAEHNFFCQKHACFGLRTWALGFILYVQYWAVNRDMNPNLCNCSPPLSYICTRTLQ